MSSVEKDVDMYPKYMLVTNPTAEIKHDRWSEKQGLVQKKKKKPAIDWRGQVIGFFTTKELAEMRAKEVIKDWTYGVVICELQELHVPKFDTEVTPIDELTTPSEVDNAEQRELNEVIDEGEEEYRRLPGIHFAGPPVNARIEDVGDAYQHQPVWAVNHPQAYIAR
jgi:hypothetical protein